MSNAQKTTGLCLEVITMSRVRFRTVTLGSWCFGFGRMYDKTCAAVPGFSSMATTRPEMPAEAASSSPARRGRKSRASASGGSKSSGSPPVGDPPQGDLLAAANAEPDGSYAEPANIFIGSDGNVIDRDTGEVIGHVTDDGPRYVPA